MGIVYCRLLSQIKKFRENNAEYDDMTDTEIIQIYGLDKEVLNKYDNQYIEKLSLKTSVVINPFYKR